MKFFSTALVLFTFLITNTNAETISLEKKANIKEELTKSYNAVSKMSSAEYVENLEMLSQTLQSKGLTREAQILTALKNDPTSQIEVLAQMKDKLENMSENGLFFILYLYEPDYWCQYGDYFCGYLVFLLTILTLEGQEASEL